VSKAPKHW